jgi:hypothetical protein
MGMIRGAVDKTSSIKDIDSLGQHRDPGFAGARTLPAAGHECRDAAIDTGLQPGQAPDSSRSRGYGRYEI